MRLLLLMALMLWLQPTRDTITINGVAVTVERDEFKPSYVVAGPEIRRNRLMNSRTYRFGASVERNGNRLVGWGVVVRSRHVGGRRNVERAYLSGGRELRVVSNERLSNCTATLGCTVDGEHGVEIPNDVIANLSAGQSLRIQLDASSSGDPILEIPFGHIDAVSRAVARLAAHQ